MTEFVLKCYNEYNTFMDLNTNNIKINPIMQENTLNNNSIAYVDANEILNPIVNLYISPELEKRETKYQKVKLFHEFTHIIDANTLFKNCTYKNLTILMSTYSEYHASQIELAYNIGFNNIHNFRRINLDKTFIINEDGEINIKSDFLMQMLDALTIIDKPSSDYNSISVKEYYLNYKNFKTKTMYYLGKKNLCEKYSLKKTADITEDKYKTFYPYIKQIEHNIINKNYENIITSEIELWDYYCSYFIYKDKELLQKLVND